MDYIYYDPREESNQHSDNLNDKRHSPNAIVALVEPCVASIEARKS